MSILESLLLVVHVLVAAGICAFVLLQHGKGADMGAAFGSGASGSLFGASGSANFLSRTTAILAAVFFATSLGLTWYAATRSAPRAATQQQGVMDRLPPPKAAQVPADTGGQPATPAPAAGGEAGKSASPAAPGSKAADVPK